MLTYKYYFNVVTRTIGKHRARVLLFYHINSPVMLKYKYYINAVARTVSKNTATVLSWYHININFTQSNVPSVNTQLQSCNVTL